MNKKTTFKKSFKFAVLLALPVLSSALFALHLSGRFAIAQEMSSESFKIQSGNLNMTSGNKSSQNFRLSDVVGQTAATIFTSKGYIIQAGFLNSAATVFFGFSITPQIIDFGQLTPNNPVEKNVQISIANGETQGYQVLVAENHPLATSLAAEIPDTACDGDASGICTQTQAAKWIKNTTNGFGYRITGNTTPSDFSNEGFFRPFPAISRGENKSLIMQSQNKNANDSATMTLRVNIGASQPVGQYRNVIQFTAIVGI